MHIEPQRPELGPHAPSARTRPSGDAGAFDAHLARQGGHPPSSSVAAPVADTTRVGSWGGTPMWHPRLAGPLTGDDAEAPTDTRSWDFAGYDQVRGTLGRELREIVGSDPWLWQLAEHTGMPYPAAAVNSVLGDLARAWAERVGYERPAGLGGSGASVLAQYVRNPSGLEADHARLATAAARAAEEPATMDETKSVASLPTLSALRRGSPAAATPAAATPAAATLAALLEDHEVGPRRARPRD
jgi:hypothetical protein